MTSYENTTVSIEVSAFAAQKLQSIADRFGSTPDEILNTFMKIAEEYDTTTAERSNGVVNFPTCQSCQWALECDYFEPTESLAIGN
jgi:hypothetical protein